MAISSIAIKVDLEKNNTKNKYNKYKHSVCSKIQHRKTLHHTKTSQKMCIRYRFPGSFTTQILSEQTMTTSRKMLNKAYLNHFNSKLFNADDYFICLSILC